MMLQAFVRPLTGLVALAWIAFEVCVLDGRPAWGQTPPKSGVQPAYRMAERSNPTPENSRPFLAAAQPNEHPLMPTLRWAHEGLKNLEKIEDYSAVVVKQERIDGKLNEPEYIFTKVRHRPFSAYLRFLKPDELKGQETIYLAGPNGAKGKMWGHGTGVRKIFGTVPLDPTGPIAMSGNRYPITEIGILNLVRRLVEVGEKDIQYGECEVKFYPGAKINDRVCTCIQVVHPTARSNFLFHVARIFVDDELNLPIRYEAYDWPAKPGGPPELTEEYTYLNLKLNNHFTDADFDIRNPEYGFKSQRTARRER